MLNSLSHQDEIMFNCTLHSRKLVVDGQFFPHFHANDIVITGNKNEMIQLYVTEEEAKWIVGLPQSI